MPRVIAAFLFGVWLGCLTTGVAQLPPDVLVDQYLLQADRLMEAKDAKGALEMMGKIVALQKEHSLTLPNEFHFKYAKVAFSAGSIMAAKESVNHYLTVAGREGEFYSDALELSLEIAELGADRTPCAEQPKGSACWMELANQPKTYVWNLSYQPYRTVTWSGDYLGNLAHGRGTLKWVVDLDPKPRDVSLSQVAEPKCAGQPEGTSCWMEITGQPGCYVWNPNPHPDETVTWSGECAAGLAQGDGTRKWVWDGGKKTSEGKGLLRDGNNHGQWTWRNVEGKEEKGFYVYGEYLGRTADDEIVMEGLLVKGKKHGDWVERFPDGDVAEGPYVEGERHGDWSEHDADKDVRSGPYVHGKRQGHWVERLANGDVEEGHYEQGKRQGQWVFRRAKGTVVEGFFLHGKLDGDWVVRSSNMVRIKGSHANGTAHGRWIWFFEDGNVASEGTFVHGKKNGDWVEYEDGQRITGSYAKGKRYGLWLWYGSGEDAENITDLRHYKNGLLHGEYVQYLQAVELFSRDAGDPKNYREKGSYVEGKKHGPWIESGGEEKGSYVHGEKDGPWIEWLETIPGTLSLWHAVSGSYLDGKRHGDWELSKSNKNGVENWKGSFVNGKLHGLWRQETSAGTIKGVYYEEGKEQNSWLYKDAVGNTFDGPIVDGKKHGVWNEFYFQTEDHTLYIEGYYENGQRDGRWNIYRLSDRKKKVRGGGLYVNGKKKGPWVEYRDYNGRKTKYDYGRNY